VAAVLALDRSPRRSDLPRESAKKLSLIFGNILLGEFLEQTVFTVQPLSRSAIERKPLAKLINLGMKWEVCSHEQRILHALMHSKNLFNRVS